MRNEIPIVGNQRESEFTLCIARTGKQAHRGAQLWQTYYVALVLLVHIVAIILDFPAPTPFF